VFQVHYQPATDRIVNFGYRFRDGILEQTDVSTQMPVNRNWHVVGRWNRSLRDGKDLEKLVGLEYQSCCYALRVVWRNYVNDVSGATNNAVFVQLELKGLTRVGQDVSGLLEHGILGYQDNR
jgi:LPS-assembly protein